MGLKSFAEAEAAFKSAIAVDPDYQAAYSWLGQALFEQKRYGEARSAVESARKFNDHDATIHNWLGRVALIQQQYE
jgi:cytochrome c-type biogenesis protein CcmH/NrfG